MPSYSQTVRLLIVAAIVALSVLTAGGQSGRKVRKSTPLPAPTPAPETAVAKPKEDHKPALTLIVGMLPSFFNNAQMGNAGGPLHSLEDRLDDSPGVKVAHLWGDVSRSDAIRRAKSEKEAYVVLLELSVETGAGSRDEEILLYYWVFSPVTAKIKTSGQTYVRMYRNRGVIPNPRTANIYGDYQVLEAARDVAIRILKAFQLH